jgi:hypothetical protein
VDLVKEEDAVRRTLLIFRKRRRYGLQDLILLWIGGIVRGVWDGIEGVGGDGGSVVATLLIMARKGKEKGPPSGVRLMRRVRPVRRRWNQWIGDREAWPGKEAQSRGRKSL